MRVSIAAVTEGRKLPKLKKLAPWRVVDRLAHVVGFHGGHIPSR
jgi:hypothetical protein